MALKMATRSGCGMKLTTCGVRTVVTVVMVGCVEVEKEGMECAKQAGLVLVGNR